MQLDKFLEPSSEPAKRVDPRRTATVRDIEQAIDGKAERCLLLPELLSSTGCELFWRVPYAEGQQSDLLVPALKSHVRSLLSEGKAIYVSEANPLNREFTLAIAQSFFDLPRLAPYAGGDFFTADLKQFMCNVTLKRIRAVAANRSYRGPGYEGQAFLPPTPKPRVGYLSPSMEGSDDFGQELDMSGLHSKAAGVEEFIPAAARIITSQLQSATVDQYFSLHDFCRAANKLISDEGQLPLQLNRAHYRAAKTILTGAGFAVFNRKRMGSQGNLIPVFASVKAQMRFIDQLNSEALSNEERNDFYARRRFRFEGIDGEDNSGFDTNEDDGADE